MLGSQRRAGYSEKCVEDFYDVEGRHVHFVYGPFEIFLIRRCLRKGGGLMCLSNRWQADFFLFLVENHIHEKRSAVHCDRDHDLEFDCEGFLFSPDFFDFFFFCFFLHLSI